MSQIKIDFQNNFSRCRSFVDSSAWNKIVSGCENDDQPNIFLQRIEYFCRDTGAPEYLPELARLEWHIEKIKRHKIVFLDTVEEAMINPSLILLDLHWMGLPAYLNSPNQNVPVSGEEFAIVWKHLKSGDVRAETASAGDLLVLKMISEGIDRKDLARTGKFPVNVIDAAMERVVEKGFVFIPASGIRRNWDISQISPYNAGQFQSASTFTLQLHVTQACDLHCKHCYDRSNRSALTLSQAFKILEDLDNFCIHKKVRGQVCFSGGNPLMHPDFPAIYKTASEYGFTLSILGNPSTRKQIEELHSIYPLNYFQVSLEGLPEYNDEIRGRGHFDRTMIFLDLLRDLNIYSMVMLTLNKDNIDQVIPLAERLQNKTDAFFFNRLALVGEGASLALPSKEKYIDFLEKYLEATKDLPILGLKDNFLNIIMQKKAMDPFGGCTGFGCGAAFNFLAVLSDGEVHACRKFPSLIGNLFHQSIGEIYESEISCRYRAGCAECASCTLKPVCGGCLASAYSHGLDIFKQKDPLCFI